MAHKWSRRSTLLLVLALAVTAWIFSNSLQPAVVSSGESMSLLRYIQPIFTFFGIPEAYCHTLLRKLAHFSEFGLVGVLWTALAYDRGAGSWRGALGCAAAGLFIALVDETLQLFVPGRSGMVADLWVDLAGAAAGTLAALVLRMLLQRRNHKKGT